MKTLYNKIKHIALNAIKSSPLGGWGVVALLGCGIFALFPITASAQITAVHGTVSDEFGPVLGATVCEMDGNGRIVESAITDMSGNFALKVRNPKDKIRFSYVGLQTVTKNITQEVYNITLESKTTLNEVTITAKQKNHAGGLAIPQDQVSFASQTIDMKEFEGLGINSVDEALQGRISGLDIVGVSGNLGAGTSMRLRGTTSVSSLTSSNPLIVVNGNTRNVDMSGFDIKSANDEQFAQLLNVNPEDIKEITVLKDAAGKGLYGSQGANGVILITTKRGTRGKPQVSYKLTLTGTYQPEGYEMLNGDDYTMLLKEAYFNPQQDRTASNINELNYDPSFSEYQQYNKNTDWRDAVTQFGLRQNHSISINGGGEKASFRISAGYDHETGSIIEQKLQRFTTRVALDYVISERIQVSTNFSFTYTKNKKNYDDLLAIAQKKMPNMTIYEIDRTTGRETNHYYNMLQSASSVFDGDQKTYVNPVASAHLSQNDENTYDITPELILRYDLLGIDEDSWRLKYEGNVYMNIFNDYVDQYYPQELRTVSWNQDNTGVNLSYVGSNKSQSITTKHALTLTPYFKNKDNEMLVYAGMELTSGHANGLYTSGKLLPSGSITRPDAGGLITDLSTSYSQSRSLYFLGRVHYAYKDRYVADLNCRVDGSTKFGAEQRWGYFPSASLRWNISYEPWMKPAEEWLSLLALRASWGKTGNQPSEEYLYSSKYASGSRYMDKSSMYPTNIRISDLQWETTNEYNLGADVNLLHDKLMLAIDWYTSVTDNMLMGGVKIPSSTGFSTLSQRNVGSMQNTGWEFNITTNNIIKAGRFGADFNVTFGNNRNEILTMDESVLKTLNTDFDYANGSTLQRVQLHNPFGAIYGFRFKGVYEYKYQTFCDLTDEERQSFLAAGHTAPIALTADGEIIYDGDGNPQRMMYNYTNDGTGKNYKFKGGDAIYEDVNNDGNIDALDIVYLGSSLPKLTGGFGFNLSYDNWRLNCQFNYRYGNKILNMARLDAEAMTGNNNQCVSVNYRWRKDGDQTDIPRAMNGTTSNYNSLVSDRYVEDGSFIRLNYVQLSYGLKKSAAKKIGLSALRFYLSANNLFCLTEYSGVDPEVGYGGYSISSDTGQTPRAKSFTFGMSVDF